FVATALFGLGISKASDPTAEDLSGSLQSYDQDSFVSTNTPPLLLFLSTPIFT
ncbi:hypothetical protein PanWU01x14_056270, partial [Parasponia andersonii]